MSNTIPEELLPEKAPFNIQMLDELFFNKKTNDIGLTDSSLSVEELEDLIKMQGELGLLEPECNIEHIVLHAHRDDRRQTMSLMFLGHEVLISDLQIVQDRFSGIPNFSIEKYFIPGSNIARAIDISELSVGVCIENVQLSNAFYKIWEYLEKHGNTHKQS